MLMNSSYDFTDEGGVINEKLIELGFEQWDTGGGCTALVYKENLNDSLSMECWITCDTSIPTEEEWKALSSKAFDDLDFIIGYYPRGVDEGFDERTAEYPELSSFEDAIKAIREYTGIQIDGGSQ